MPEPSLPKPDENSNSNVPVADDRVIDAGDSDEVDESEQKRH